MLCSRGVSGPGWCLVLGGVPGLRGVIGLGRCLVPGGLVWGGIPACTGADPPPWTEFLTHASENITLPQTSFAGGKNVNKEDSRLYTELLRMTGDNVGQYRMTRG